MPPRSSSPAKGASRRGGPKSKKTYRSRPVRDASRHATRWWWRSSVRASGGRPWIPAIAILLIPAWWNASHSWWVVFAATAGIIPVLYALRALILFLGAAGGRVRPAVRERPVSPPRAVAPASRPGTLHTERPRATRASKS